MLTQLGPDLAAVRSVAKGLDHALAGRGHERGGGHCQQHHQFRSAMPAMHSSPTRRSNDFSAGLWTSNRHTGQAAQELRSSGGLQRIALAEADLVHKSLPNPTSNRGGSMKGMKM